MLLTIKDKVEKYVDKNNDYLRKAYANEDFTGKFIINMIYKKNQKGGQSLPKNNEGELSDFIIKGEEFDADTDRELFGFLGALDLTDTINNVYGEQIGECVILNKRASHLYKFKNVSIRPSIRLPKCIDLNQYDNCCNLFTFVVYMRTDSKSKSFSALYKSLEDIQESVLNIKNILPEWISRIYIDISVITALKYIKLHECEESMILLDKIIKVLDNLFADRNVEIYVVLECNPEYPIAYFNLFKSLPLIEEDVNMVAFFSGENIKHSSKKNIWEEFNDLVHTSPINISINIPKEQGICLFKVNVYPQAYRKAYKKVFMKNTKNLNNEDCLIEFLHYLFEISL